MVRLPLRSLLLSALLLSACTCGSPPPDKAPPAPVLDVAAELAKLPEAKESRPVVAMPATVDWVVAAADGKGAFEALRAAPLGKAMQAGGLLDDVELSVELEALLGHVAVLGGLAHQPDLVPQALGLLEGPVALGGKRQAGGRDSLLLVKAIDAKQATAVKLAAGLAALRGNGTRLRTVAGHQVLLVGEAGAALQVATFRTLLLISTSEKLLDEALALVSGAGAATSFSELPEVRALAGELTGSRALGWNRYAPEDVLRELGGLERLALRVDPQAATVDLSGMATEGGGASPWAARGLLPLDVLAAGGIGTLDAERLLARLGKATGKPHGLDGVPGLMPADWKGALAGEAFWALLGFDGREPDHVAGFALTSVGALASKVPALVGAWSGARATPRTFARSKGACAPKLCAAVVGNHLVVGFRPESIERLAKVEAGEAPALSDAPSAKAAPAGPLALAGRIATGPLSKALGPFFVATAESGHQKLDVDDVAQGATPLLRALEPLPGFSFWLAPTEARLLSGKVALDR